MTHLSSMNSQILHKYISLHTSLLKNFKKSIIIIIISLVPTRLCKKREDLHIQTSETSVHIPCPNPSLTRMAFRQPLY